MELIPDEIKLYIFRYLDIKSLLSIMLINRQYNILCKDDSIWKYWVHELFDDVPCNDNWYQTYIYWINKRLLNIKKEKFYINVDLQLTRTIRNKNNIMGPCIDECLEALDTFLNLNNIKMKYFNIDIYNNRRIKCIPVNGLLSPKTIKLLRFLKNKHLYYKLLTMDITVKKNHNIECVNYFTFEGFYDIIDPIQVSILKKYY